MYAGAFLDWEISNDRDREPRLDTATHQLLQQAGFECRLPRGIGGRKRLQEIKGNVPSLQNLPPGCAFAARCPHVMAQCRDVSPPLEQKRIGHWAACWYATGATGGA